ncbi:leucyl aminopeptidase [Plantibacter cousiniae (nom. nud.)]|uniref:Probable cytosol aminopeptidase n=1 Tax=Plantibacter cousiniae (nom. nud.) TaxID=199709 RepID=A0ABY1LGN7_9MICO|nr:leucyl aminopeptidase [Plantibacter cousiniae]SKC38463.1 leucyl aminopeptidase [Plantibacter cousiniae]
MPSRPTKLIPPTFSRTPSLDAEAVELSVAIELPEGVEAIGLSVAPAADGAGDDIPAALGLDRAALTRAGFTGEIGQTLVIPSQDAPTYIAVGVGAPEKRTPSALRDIAAAFARAASSFASIGLDVARSFDLDPASAGQLVVEGALLARYRYTELKRETKRTPLVALHLVAGAEDLPEIATGAHRGEVLARAANLARDLANTPPGHLTATDLAEVAETLGAANGLDVEVFDKDALIDLGLGGLLGVNAGSVEEPRMIKLRYTPKDDDGSPIEAAGHLALVGKGIMYDSGGISLKPSDPSHAAMKMDMAGAGAILSAMTALEELHCTSSVTAFLMCTDNMPSGSATMLGDVLTFRNGTTVEIKNTDAEGRLVLADGLSLAVEEEPDAIVDIATLTGAAIMALGTKTAAVHGTDQGIVDQTLASSKATDEQLWQLPLERSYRKQLDSDVADLANIGGRFAGSTLAALFLAEFVGDIPWAHLDIAGTMLVESDESWRSKGATGYGTRLLIDLALNFRA